MEGVLVSDTEFYEALKVMQCDIKEEYYCVYGNITSFMGAQKELIINEDVMCIVNGEKKSLMNHFVGIGKSKVVVI